MTEEERILEQIKDEDITMYEIDSNDNFDYESLSEEEQEELAKKNDAFERSMKLRFYHHGELYKCCGSDDYFHGAIVLSHNGLMEQLLLHVQQCKSCKKIEMWGDMRPMLREMGNIYCNHLNAIYEETENVGGTEEMAEDPKFIMKDLETGAEEEAGDLASALFGAGGSGKDKYVLGRTDEGAPEDGGTEH